MTETHDLNAQPDPKGRKDHWGDPMTKAAGRLQDLRDSGYKGWVDQSGNRVPDAEVGLGTRP